MCYNNTQETIEALGGMDVMPKHSDIYRCRYVCIFKLSFKFLEYPGTYVDKARMSWLLHDELPKSNLNSIALIPIATGHFRTFYCRKVGIIQILSYLIKEIIIITLCICV